MGGFLLALGVVDGTVQLLADEVGVGGGLRSQYHGLEGLRGEGVVGTHLWGRGGEGRGGEGKDV